MNEQHDALQRYFTDRSPHVEVPTVGAAAIARRGARRRHRRTAMKVGAVLGVLAIGAAVAVQGGRDGDQKVASHANAVVASPLTWTLVDAPKGLGGLDQSTGATTSDGATYRLSTGPSSSFDSPQDQKRVLYRSTDDVEWSPTALPAELSASAISADGDRLYAVGTAPAGGGVGVRLASSAGGSDWTTADVPLDLKALGAGFPGRVVPVGTQVASARGTTVVAVAVRAGFADGALPEGIDQGSGWGVTPTGIDTYQRCPDDPTSDRKAGVTTTVVGSTPAPSTTTGSEGAAIACKEDVAAHGPKVVRSWTWAELGLTPDQGALANGRTYLFTAGSDGSLTQTGMLAGSPWGMDVLASDDGFWLVRSVDQSGPTVSDERTEAVLSPDGRDWNRAGFDLPGTPAGSGLLAGRPAVAVRSDDQLQLAILSAGGPQVTDVTAALGTTGPKTFVSSEVAIGPLGVAFTLTGEMGADDVEGRTQVVHSSDGTSFDETDLPAAPAGRTERVSNLSVSADAVIVRLNSYPKGAIPGDGGVRPTQRAFVGTID